MHYLCGLIGADIQRSRSPAMHVREASNLGFTLEYRLIDTSLRRSEESTLPLIFEELEREGFIGTNVTHPFKQQVIPLLDEVSDAAKKIGAVNTVILRDKKRIGHNTDWSGYRENFQRGLPDASLERVGLIGAGGAAAAVAYALLSMRARRLDIYDVDFQKAVTLANRLSHLFPEATICPLPHIEDAVIGASGIVQSTPVGMDSHPGTPFSPTMLQSHQWVSEIIYFPRETEFLSAARKQNCKVLDGVGMAVFQAADAFLLFTGVRPDRDRMYREFD